MNNTLYALDFDKISDGCKDKWFGSTDLSLGTTPKKIVIDDSEPLHLVQILHLLKKIQWDDDRWYLFTKKDILDTLQQDEHKNNFVSDFGQNFFDEFPHQTNYFISQYCTVAGEY